MNRTEYLEALSRRLRLIPQEDRQDAIDYYDEFIGECDPSGELDVVQILGSPKEVASKIIDDCTVRYADDRIEGLTEDDMSDNELEGHGSGKKKKNSAKKAAKAFGGGARIIWLALIGVASLPVWFPITLVACIFALTAILVVLALVLAVGASGAVVFLRGGFAIISSVFTGSFGQTMVNLGAGIAAMGVGILLIIGAGMIVRLMLKTIRKSVSDRRARKLRKLSKQ